jgi:hypothetical protein
MEWSATIMVTVCDIRITMNKVDRNLEMPPETCQHQRCHAFIIKLLHVCATLHQLLDSLQITTFRYSSRIPAVVNTNRVKGGEKAGSIEIDENCTMGSAACE